MTNQIWFGIMIPLIGTALGSACVYLMKQELSVHTERVLTGFAAGVMTAACIWSLIIPSMEQSKELGRLLFVPATIGFWTGILFLLMIDRSIPHLHLNSDKPEGPHSNLSRTAMMLLAVTIHNIPEGMAVGVVYAALANGGPISSAAALSLALGIAIQNFPEGAIISMPLRAEGMSQNKSFIMGVLSGAVEPAAALLTIAAVGMVSAALPYFLSFAAGAMMYVVVEELIPEMSQGEHSNIGTVAFAAGFSVMMILDVVLG